MDRTSVKTPGAGAVQRVQLARGVGSDVEERKIQPDKPVGSRGIVSCQKTVTFYIYGHVTDNLHAFD